MKKIAKYMLALSVAGSLTTGSLFAQYDDECCEYECSAPECGLSFCGVPCWAWITGGLTIGGLAAIAATHNSTKAHNE